MSPSVIHVNLGNLSKASSKTPGNLQISDFRGCFCEVKIFFYSSKYWPWNRGGQFPSTHIQHRSLHFPKIQNAFLTPENNGIWFLSFCYLCCHAMLSSICCVTHQISTANAIRRTNLNIIRWLCVWIASHSSCRKVSSYLVAMSCEITMYNV